MSIQWSMTVHIHRRHRSNVLIGPSLAGVNVVSSQKPTGTCILMAFNVYTMAWSAIDLNLILVLDLLDTFSLFFVLFPVCPVGLRVHTVEHRIGIDKLSFRRIQKLSLRVRKQMVLFATCPCWGL